MKGGNFRFPQMKASALSVISPFKLNMCLWICPDHCELAFAGFTNAEDKIQCINVGNKKKQLYRLSHEYDFIAQSNTCRLHYISAGCVHYGYTI